VLSRRALNRALLARQMLLAREKTTALAAIERLVGMQAQVPRPPFGGLWTRLQKFERDDLLRLYREKKVVRATAMRGTIHLLSTEDFIALRPALAPMLIAGAQSVVGKRMGDLDVEQLYRIGRDFFGRQTAPFDDFRKALVLRHPKVDVRAMAYAVRMGIPLVMVPTNADWGFPGNAGFTLAETWLGKTIPDGASALDTLVLRYLAAFGPATPSDAQAWSGLRGLKDTFEWLRPTLVTFADERKRELFDLPDAPRPDETAPASVRFLPEFDNILLSHDDRTRIIADEHRRLVYSKNLLVAGTYLVDGFVAGTWRLDVKTKAATLMLAPFSAFNKKTVTAVQQEGEAMLRFLAPHAGTYEVVLRR